MKSNEIRQAFLDFFQSKGHHIVPSAPIVNKDDPTLLFTNAGMNQFKDYFLGNQVSKYKRIADTQKCLRVSGKHNDLEEVGLDTYHHTMFEMLGNWSIGDYFKEEAIAWSWELLTEVYKLPKDRLYVTVFGGDPSEKLERDMEAYNFWKKWIAEDRILFGSKKDNFWEMGEQGPCGPCSEIHVDLRKPEDIAKLPGKQLVNESDPLVVEIWNNVFIQFNRKADGSLEELPEKHVDTGMGFERLAMAVQGKASNYDTDVFQPMISFIAKESGIPYTGKSEKSDIAMRVLADHIRAISFTIADGQLPSNAKAGYVIRRILRRAVRYAYTFLNLKEPFLHRMVPVLAEQFKDVFPELQAQVGFVSKVVLEEENSFLRTLETGLKRIEQLTNNFTSAHKNIEGKVVFELYDTFGFPVDLISLIARENGYTIDEAGFETEMNIQKERSRKAAVTETSDWVVVSEDDETQFVGYDVLNASAHILRHRTVKLKSAEEIHVVLDVTPFYAESGGQVGDTGFLQSKDEKIKVKDTRKENNLIIHIVDKLPKDMKASFDCKVDVERRAAIQANHSATHLLHAALKQVCGDHVNQKGSLVNDKVLRFDFSHFSKVTDEELLKVEEIVNAKIRENILLDERRSVPIAEAKSLGAMALFGEKYGEFVRVITFDPQFSRELCGGTHVSATGQIGFLKITSESSVAAGVRRIEAVTGRGAEEYVHETNEVMLKLSDLLKQPKDITKALEQLIQEKETLLKKVQALEAEQVSVFKVELLKKATTIDGVTVIIQRADVPSADAARQLAYDLKQATSSLYLVLASLVDNKPQVTVMFSDDVIEKWQVDAGKVVRDLAVEIKGGGGGQKFYATAGGKDAAGLDKVLSKANEGLKQLN